MTGSVANITKTISTGTTPSSSTPPGECWTALPRSSSRKTPRTAVLMVRCPCKGFGKLGILFSTWLKTLRGFGKDIILLAMQARTRKARTSSSAPTLTGKESKTEAYKVADLMAYMTTEDGRNGKPIKVLEFSPSSSYLAKIPAVWAGLNALT